MTQAAPEEEMSALANQLRECDKEILVDEIMRHRAEVRRLRSVLQAVANMENSPMGTAYELQRVLADVRAALATPASPPPARQGE